jgi:hypothetical protein
VPWEFYVQDNRWSGWVMPWGGRVGDLVVILYGKKVLPAWTEGSFCGALFCW